MASSWVDLATIFDPAPSQAPPATWGDQIRENEQHLYERTEKIIAHVSLGVAGSSISSGTLPVVTNGWKLRVIVKARHASATGISLGLRFNGDSGSNYHRQFVAGNDTGVTGDGQDSLDQMHLGLVGNDSASRWSVADLEIVDYRDATTHKTMLGRCHYPGNLTTTAFFINIGGVWKSTAAITSVAAVAGSGNFVVGSTLTVYATPVPV